jgi:hypothetical protein
MEHAHATPILVVCLLSLSLARLLSLTRAEAAATEEGGLAGAG